MAPRGFQWQSSPLLCGRPVFNSLPHLLLKGSVGSGRLIQPAPTLCFPFSHWRVWELGGRNMWPKESFCLAFIPCFWRTNIIPNFLPSLIKIYTKGKSSSCPIAYLHFFPGSTKAALLPGKGAFVYREGILFLSSAPSSSFWVQWGLCLLWGEAGLYRSLGPVPSSLHILGEARA